MTVNIAIIDSGINAFHPHVAGIAGGIAFHADKNRRVVEDPDFSDYIGHGTAIAGIIRQTAPDAALYAVRIFYKDLRAPGELLMAGLKWAINNGMRIIHLSLGTEEEKYRPELTALCNAATKKNIVIVAAGRHPDDGVLPAALKTVIGVYWNRESGPEETVYHPDCRIEFGAHGRPRGLPGLPQSSNFKGHSFAAGRVTAQIAGLLEKNPDADSHWLKQGLITKTLIKAEPNQM